MSIWCDVDVIAYGNEKSLAKLLNLKPKDIDGLNKVKLSFGRKNGVDFNPIVKNNPDLVFLVQTAIECFSGNIRIVGYDKVTDVVKCIFLEAYSYDMIELNKKILEDCPEIFQEYKKIGSVDWKKFLSNEKSIRELLNQANQYEELSYLIDDQELEFDNQFLDEE